MQLAWHRAVVYALPAVLLIAAGAASLAAQLYIFPAEAESSDWKPAAAYVRKRVDSDDRIRTHPPWNLDGLPYLESLGDQVDRRFEPLAEDLYRADRIWVLSETQRVQEAIDRIPFDDADISTRQFGPVTVVRATVPDDARFSWEARRNLSEAKVERIIPKKKGPPKIRHCDQWSEGKRRWDCGGYSGQHYVGEVFKYLGLDPHRAIWAHPIGGDRDLRVTFPEVPLGELLRVRAGFTHLASRRDHGSPVTIEVRLDGETRAQRTYPVLESSWKPIDLETSQRAGETAELSILVQGKKVRDRRFCFNAWVR